MKLTNEQKEFVIGFLLGDAYAERHPVNCRLGFHHSIAQLEYVRWKHRLLTPYSGKLTQYQAWDKKEKKWYKKCRFCTYTREIFNIYRELFYPQGQKIVPSNVGELLTSNGLAVWYLDDGSYRKERGTFRINTHSFSYRHLELLQAALYENFSVNTSIYSSRPKKKGERKKGEDFDYVLHVDKASAQQFHSLVSPLVRQELPLFLYKLLKPCND